MCMSNCLNNFNKDIAGLLIKYMELQRCRLKAEEVYDVYPEDPELCSIIME